MPSFNPNDTPFETSRNLSQEELYLADAVLELISNKEKLDFYRRQSEERIKDFLPVTIMKQWYQLLKGG